MTSKFIGLVTAVAMLPLSHSPAHAWHNDIVECYFYVLEQCDPKDTECLEFGFDDCDGSYDTSINRLSPNNKFRALKPAEKRKVANLNRALKRARR